MPLWLERAAAPAMAATVGAVASLLVALAVTPGPSGRVLTVMRTVPAGARVPPGDVVIAPAPPVRIPTLHPPLYATYTLMAGQPLAQGALAGSPPRRTVAIGNGMVAENVTLPQGAVPAGVAAGDTVAVAGAAGGAQGMLLAPSARVMAVANVPALPGVQAAVVYTLALPLGSALAVAQAAHAQTLALLPWSLPRREVHP